MMDMGVVLEAEERDGEENCRVVEMVYRKCTEGI